jgi:hypothetical protein
VGKVRYGGTGNMIGYMRIACWIIKATRTHSGYVIHTAFPRQQWLRERATMIRYMCIACLVELVLRYTFTTVMIMDYLLVR